jgi:hypothetical protein
MRSSQVYVSARAYLELRQQHPKQTAHVLTGQHTSRIAHNCRNNSVIAILRPSMREFVNRATCRNIILILVNYDNSFSAQDCEYTRKLRPKRVFAHNVETSALRKCRFLQSLPLGFPFHRLTTFAVRERTNQWQARRSEILVSALGKTHRRRSTLVESIKYTDCCVVDSTHTSLSQLYDRMSDFKYAVAPYGAGFDTFRAWEILSLGSCPIILRDETHSVRVYDNTCSVVIDSFEQLGNRSFVMHLMRRQYVRPTIQYIDHWKRLFRNLSTEYNFSDESAHS